MKAVLDSIQNYIVIVGRNGNIKFCNIKLLNKLFDEGTDLINISIDKLINYDNKQLLKIIKEVKRGEKINIDVDFTSEYKDNTLLNCDVLIEDFNNEESVFIIGRDICEKHYNREILESALDTLPFSIWIKNLDGRFKYVNKYNADMLKLNKVDIIGKYDKDIVDNETYKFFNLIDQQVIKNKIPKLFEETKQKNNSKIYFETYKAPIVDEKDEVEFTVGISNNVTMVKKLIEETSTNNYIIHQVKNITTKGTLNIEFKDIIKEIGNELFECLEADNMIIYRYNEKTSYLEEEAVFGRKIENVKNDLLYLSKQSVEKMKSNKMYECIKNIEEIEYQSIKDLMVENKINYTGVYSIMFNDELMGILSTNYFDKNKAKVIMDDFTKAMCSFIGLHMKNQELSKDISYEVGKRAKTEKELEDLLELSVDLIIKVKSNGRIVKVNNKWQETLGWSEEELLKKNILEIIHEDYHSDTLDLMAEPRELFEHYINKILCKDGTYRIISWNLKTVPNYDLIIATGKDITKQRQEEENRRKLEEVVKLETFKNEFFANISHEFKTPLNIILGSIQLITRNLELEKLPNGFEEKYKNYIKPIKQNSYRLLRLVNNLIDITRIDSGFYQMQLGNYDIVSIVENITLSVAQYVEHNGINLVFDTNCEEKIIACDPDKIERIMLNLLSNAIKYTRDNGQIFVNISVNRKNVCISIQDDGIGIPENELDAIFERFKQVDNVLTRKCEGSGIGLSLVKSLVELHKGKIYVNSKLGIGTKFTFELPIEIFNCKQKCLMQNNVYKDEQIEKCNIEFSDIYV